jgi:hypothetical protein
MSTIHFLKQFAGNLGGVACLLAVLVIPILILITIVGFIFRRSRWIAPVWIFFAGPVLLLLACLLPFLPQMVRSLFTADRNDILLSLCEPALGIAFLSAYPRGAAWGSHVKTPCIIAGFLSIIAIVLWIYVPQSFSVAP